MSYSSRIGIAWVVAAALSLAACNSDKPEEAPAEKQQTGAVEQPAAPAGAKLDSEQARYSYAIGYQIGSSLKERLEDIDTATLAQGLQEAMSGTAAKLKPEEMQAALQSYQEAQNKKVQERMQAAAAEGEAFLEANRNKEGVKQTESGLQYKVLEPGTGKQPGPNDTVVVNYRGTLLNGKEFDSSYSRGEPVTLPVNGVIPGWQEALQMMKEGAKWKIFVPPKLAYGEHGAGDVIGPNETLVFEIELMSIKNDTDNQAQDGAKPDAGAADGQQQPDAAAQPEAEPAAPQESKPAAQ